VLDVLEGEREFEDVDPGVRHDYRVVVGLAHGLPLDEIQSLPAGYLDLLDAYHAIRSL
jgi:tmRNA-binding protein